MKGASNAARKAFADDIGGLAQMRLVCNKCSIGIRCPAILLVVLLSVSEAGDDPIAAELKSSFAEDPNIKSCFCDEDAEYDRVKNDPAETLPSGDSIADDFVVIGQAPRPSETTNSHLCRGARDLGIQDHCDHSSNEISDNDGFSDKETG